jgi:two-component system KDP operon response regulator KdpE
LLQAVWGAAYGTESTYLRTYMSQLRRKLGDDAARPTVIRTEPGLGYRWIAGGSGAD